MVVLTAVLLFIATFGLCMHIARLVITLIDFSLGGWCL